MMKRRTILLVLLPLLLGVGAAAQNYYPNQLVVKFSSSSPEGIRWLQGGRQGAIPSLEALLGDHTTEGFILDATLTAVRKARESKVPQNSIQQTSIRL